MDGGAGRHVGQHSPCTYDGCSPEPHDRCPAKHRVTCVEVHTVSGRRHDGQHMPLDVTAMSVAAHALKELEQARSWSDVQRLAPLAGGVPAALVGLNLHVVQQLVRLKAGTSLVEQTRKVPEVGFMSAAHADMADWEVQSRWPKAVDEKSICSETLHVMQQVVGSRVGAWPNGQFVVGTAHDCNLRSSQLPDTPFKVRHVGQPVVELTVGMTPLAQIGEASKLDLLHCTVPVVCGIHVGQHLLLLAKV